MDKEEIAKKNMVDKIKEEVKIMSRINTNYIVKLFYALHREKKVYLVSFLSLIIIITWQQIIYLTFYKFISALQNSRFKT